MKPRKALPRYDAPSAVMRAAGAWLARRDRGLSAAEQAELEAWLQAAAEHRAAIAQLDRAFATFEGLKELAPHQGVEPNPDVFAPERHSRRWIFPSLAAAGLAAAAALVIVFLPSQVPPPATMSHYATNVTGYERAVLSDGTVIELNDNTALAVEFTATERLVRLTRGEAHFRVAKNPARPFAVVAGSVAVRVVGTTFSVRMEPAAIEVLVTEGVVRLVPPVGALRGGTLPAEASDDAPVLTAGQKIVVSTATDAAPPVVASVTADEIQRALAWQPRVVELEKMPLAGILAEFNRHSAGRHPPIVIGDHELASLRIGGNFRVDQPDAFVRLLESSFGIVADRSGEMITLREAR